MSLISSPLSLGLNDKEWQELNALRLAISDNPAAVVPSQQERFTFLFAQSIKGKGDKLR